MKFEELIGVQDQKELNPEDGIRRVFNLDVVYETPGTDPSHKSPWSSTAGKFDSDPVLSADETPWPTLSLKIAKKELDPLQYRYYIYENQVWEEWITAVLDIADDENLTDNPFPNCIISNCSKIAIDTRRGAGNFVIMHPSVTEKFRESKYRILEFDDVEETDDVIRCIGKVNCTIDAYEYIGNQLAEDEVIVGYKGPGVSDTGIIMSLHETEENYYQIVTMDNACKYYRWFKV